MNQVPVILSHPLVLLAIAILGPMLRDFVVGLLRKAARRMLADKDPKNDVAAHLIEDAADAVDKLKVNLKG